MPNTLIREGYLDSGRVAKLDAFTETVLFRLLLAADDAGRTDGRPSALKARLFPVHQNVRVAQIDAAVKVLKAQGLIVEWEWQEKLVLQVARWQRRSPAQISKQPDPHGEHRINWVKRSTADGEKDFVSESLPEAMQMGSGRDSGALPQITGDVVEDEDVVEDGMKGGASPLPVVPKRSRSKPEPELPFISDAFKAAWDNWRRHRREKRNALTPSTERTQIEKLSTLTEAHAIATIERSISQGWLGLFPESAGPITGPISPQRNTPKLEPKHWETSKRPTS